MEPEVARRWLSSVVPSWTYRWLMPAGWLAALIVSVASDGQTCSVAEPCEPSASFSISFALALVSLGLWWSMPRAAAVVGLVYLVPELRYDDVAGARLAWTAYAAGCLVVLAALTWSRRRQLALSASLPRVPVRVRAAATVGVTVKLWLAGVLVIAGVGALAVMRAQAGREEGHVSRAVKVVAVVDSVKDVDLELRLPDGGRRTATPIEDYPRGAQVPVLIDPADGDWVRLQAEPGDYTSWYTVTGVCWLLALALLGRDLRRRRSRPREASIASGLPVRLALHPSGRFAILPAKGNDPVLGYLRLEVADKPMPKVAYNPNARRYDRPEPRPRRRNPRGHSESLAMVAALDQPSRGLSDLKGEAYFVGSLADGEWPTVVAPHVTLRAASPFHPPRRTPLTGLSIR